MSADVTLSEDEREALWNAIIDDRDREAGYRVLGPGGTDGQTPTIGEAVTRILADRLARVTARAERAEAQVERVRAVVRDWAAATCIADGAPCSFHRQSPEHASDVRAALAETETGHQARPEAPRSAEEPVSRVPGPDGVREAGRRAGEIVDSEGAW